MLLFNRTLKRSQVLLPESLIPEVLNLTSLKTRESLSVVKFLPNRCDFSAIVDVLSLPKHHQQLKPFLI
jgi:hypothetical protein